MKSVHKITLVIAIIALYHNSPLQARQPPKASFASIFGPTAPLYYYFDRYASFEKKVNQLEHDYKAYLNKIPLDKTEGIIETLNTISIKSLLNDELSPANFLKKLEDDITFLNTDSWIALGRDANNKAARLISQLSKLKEVSEAHFPIFVKNKLQQLQKTYEYFLREISSEGGSRHTPMLFSALKTIKDPEAFLETLNSDIALLKRSAYRPFGSEVENQVSTLKEKLTILKNQSESYFYSSLSGLWRNPAKKKAPLPIKAQPVAPLPSISE